MSPSNKQNRARNLLVKLLVFLTTAESCWYTINGDINHEYSLARRLGFYLQEEYYAFLVSAGLAMYRYDSLSEEKDEFIIRYKEWHHMIDGIKQDNHEVADFAKRIELTEKRFDRVNLHKGMKQRDNRRYDHILIRIGQYIHEGWSHSNITRQLKALKKNHKTPHLTGLSPLKRSLVADAREMFTNVIASDFDFYEYISKTNLEDNDDDNENDDDDESEADDDQPLTKKPKLARYSASGSALGLVGAMNAGEAEIADFVSGLSTQQYNMLFANMVKRNQKESGEDDLITYKNTGNNKKMQYVRVPTNTTEQSFLQHSGWLDKVLKVNGGGEDSAAKTTSAKRIAKKLINKLRKEEGDQVLEELGLLPQEQLKMGAVKIAAMFKAAKIRSRHRRRALLRHLRHFFGKNVFDSEKRSHAPIAATKSPAAAAPEGDAANSAPSVASRIQALKKKQADCKKKIAPLEQKLKLITNNIAKAKKYKSSLNDKINEFKKMRKNSGDGIESEMFLTLKSYGIEVQAYHGGSLHGKDVQKLMNNASDIFSSFADILKNNRKEGCEYDEATIDALCKSYAELCVLWDGAFSYASTIDPTKNDIDMYQRFVTAAVHLHVQLGLNVTPKVHLMWKHVADQMTLLGGLGNKREDWVERLHQTSGSVREQYRNTIANAHARGISMARLLQQETNQEVVAHDNLVNADACKGPRKNYTSVEELRKKMRQTIRMSALSCWEGLNPDKKHKVVEELLCGEAMT